MCQNMTFTFVFVPPAVFRARIQKRRSNENARAPMYNAGCYETNPINTCVTEEVRAFEDEKWSTCMYQLDR